MVIKTNVSQEEKDLIQEYAQLEGKSMAAYLRSKALYWFETPTISDLQQYIEALTPAVQSINDIATTSIKNKAIYEAEILELLDRVSELERVTAAALREVLKNGNPRK